ncbi:MAG: ATP-binding protein [Pseudomonadota bacterium]|nr:ATP-binding protein [Pseudomonadota bacterium]
MVSFISSSLSRKFMVGTAAGLVTVSVLFFILFMGLYQRQLEENHNNAVQNVNRLMQTSLEAAMLRRDLDGLRFLVDQLGAEDDVRRVMILNPAGEVRFSSEDDALGMQLDHACPQCETDPQTAGPSTVSLREDDGGRIFRSVHPVHNNSRCEDCHGLVSEHPVNGILVVDYDAESRQQHARETTLVLMGSGAMVVFVTVLGGWWFMRQQVLKPVSRLAGASASLAGGNLDSRVDVRGDDELSLLGRSFNRMAESLQVSIRETQEKEQFLQGLIDAIPDGIRVIDDRFRIVLANSTYTRQLGLKPDHVVGDTCYASSQRRNEPCPPTLVTCPVEEIRRNPAPVKTVERRRNNDGEKRDFEIYAAPMRVLKEGKEQTLVVESSRDLSADIRFSHEQKLSELGRLSAGVAHEIHNPLSSVCITLDNLARIRGNGDLATRDLDDALEIVARETNRCLEVTKRLLKLSMFAGEQLQPVSVNEAIDETLSLLVSEAARSGVNIRSNLAPTSPRILANESDIRMVVLNLAQNAIHAMPRGGDLAVTTVRIENQVEMTCKDTGVGISREDRLHIFDPFFSRRADSIKGTGLGLSICRSIVEKYRGSIAVDSTPGKGSRFTIRFPDPESDMPS